MDHQIAQQRLSDEHSALHKFLLDSAIHGLDDRAGSNEAGDMSDSEEGLTTQEQDDAVTAAMRLRLGQVHRALDRLEAGTYGFSTRSAVAISEDRLEADPAAELTAEEMLEADGPI
jgi:DnaK suppressor protein